MTYYSRTGEPLDTMTWARLHEDWDYRTVAQHYVRGWKVSTVWLGIDHGFGMSGAPIIFETMIFAPKDVTIGRDDWESAGDAADTMPDLDHFQERYATEAAAQAGHDRALAAIVDYLGDDAAMDVLSAAQFSDPAAVPDDPGELT